MRRLTPRTLAPVAAAAVVALTAFTTLTALTAPRAARPVAGHGPDAAASVAEGPPSARSEAGALRSSTAAAMIADEPALTLRATLAGLLGERGVRAAGIHDDGPSPARLTALTRRGAEAASDAPRSAADPATARLLEEEGPGTYIHELLDSARPALTRWPVRGDEPVRYWVQPGAGLPDYTPGNRRQVSDAFAEWERSGIPIRFARTADSTDADIVVVWTSRFDEPISGRTRWMHDRRGWIRSARVTIALHRYTGEVLDGDALHAIALHEVGHALGLDHASDAENVMAPRVRVRTLSDADRATARLLYRLPAGLQR